MKRTRWMKWVCCAVFACGVVVAAEARKEELTLLLVPREGVAGKVGLDIAGRYPTLLVTYKVVPGGGVSLHGWTGSKWVSISPADYVEGNFFRNGPHAALIVEEAGNPVPSMLVPPEAWCGDVFKVTTTEIRPMLHLSGQFFDFPYKDWKWFAKRYKQDVDAINPEGLNMSWYHKRLGDHLKGAAPKGSGDLQYWVALRHPVAAEEAPEIDAAELDEPDEVLEEDPFTNAVPPAVVMGAGDVPEEEGPVKADPEDTVEIVEETE